MKIRTTANIDRDIIVRIRDAAEFYGVSTMELVHVLLKIMFQEKPFKLRFNCAVGYQGRRDRDRWICFHLELSQAVYESGLDMRKIMKLSVSYLLSYAVGVYMERAVEEIMSGYAKDNYPNIYIFTAKFTPKKSTYTVFHTLPDPEDCPNHLNSSA